MFLIGVRFQTGNDSQTHPGAVLKALRKLQIKVLQSPNPGRIQVELPTSGRAVGRRKAQWEQGGHAVTAQQHKQMCELVRRLAEEVTNC